MRFNTIALTTLLFSLTAPAQAATWRFSYNADGISASGQLTTDATGSLITNISGTRNGKSISTLLPINGYANNDNIFFPSGNPGFLDELGLSYQTTDNISYNMYYSSTINTKYGECNNVQMSSCNFPYIGKPVTANFKEVPESSTILGSFLALGFLGFVSGKSKKNS
jgi:hypothetical protein